MALRESIWLGSSLFALSSGGVAHAQQAQVPTQSQVETQEAADSIVVTGTRIQRDGSTAPTPVTVLGADYMGKRAQTNVADSLNELPSFRPAQTPQGSSNRSQIAGSNFVDLRALGSSRTLTLVDGKRFVPSAGTGQVDLNNIPSILISRVEVVTGGASATYGSDAVSGVVNLILKKDVKGIEGDLQYGQSQRGDNREVRAAFVAGQSFMDDRLHLMIAGEYLRNGGAGDQFSRPWGRAQPALVVNPTPGNGFPTRVITTDVHDSRMTDGGLITAGLNWGQLTGTIDTRLVQFDANGNPAPFAVGALAGSQLMIGGDGASFFYRGFNLLPKIERKIGYGRASFEASPSLRFSLDVSYADSQVDGQAANAFNYGNLKIAVDNAYLPASVRTAMVANNLASVSFGRWSGDIGQIRTDIGTRTTRVVAGAQGSLGDNWNFDASYEYGVTRYDALLKGVRQLALFANAIDAVVNPVNGKTVCRIALTNPSTTCLPFNPFGVGRFDSASLSYFAGTASVHQTSREHAAALNIQGKLVDLPAGPMSAALGAEYRSESVNADSDAASQASRWEYGNPKPLHGSYNVREFYAETKIPLLKDSALAEHLGLSAAVRYTDYSTSGSVTTWKFGGDWQINDMLRLRLTRSRDIRAPNITELFSPSVLGPNTLRDPQTGNSYFMNVLTSGNSALRPEKADTLTAGVVLIPDRNLRFSVDYYDININSAISTLTAQSILNRCYGGEANLCGLIVRDANNVVTTVNNRYVNISSLKNRGLEFELSYRLPLNEISKLPGTFSWRTLATHTIKYTSSDGLVTTRLDGQAVNTVPSIPSWIVNSNLGYEVGGFSGLVQGRFISAGKYDNAFVQGVDINNNLVPSRFYVNISAQYKVFDNSRSKVEIYGVINNIFDIDPPLVPVYGTGATNFAYYDAIGRGAKVGVRFKY